jgi:hypothetical protein
MSSGNPVVFPTSYSAPPASGNLDRERREPNRSLLVHRRAKGSLVNDGLSRAQLIATSMVAVTLACVACSNASNNATTATSTQSSPVGTSETQSVVAGAACILSPADLQSGLGPLLDGPPSEGVPEEGTENYKCDYKLSLQGTQSSFSITRRPYNDPIWSTTHEGAGPDHMQSFTVGGTTPGQAWASLAQWAQADEPNVQAHPEVGAGLVLGEGPKFYLATTGKAWYEGQLSNVPSDPKYVSPLIAVANIIETKDA